MSNQKTKSELRADKRAAALRDNLRKRKAAPKAGSQGVDTKNKDDNDSSSA